MTEKLYEADAYRKAFTARVVSCREGTRGWETVLDRTAFYPEGGGQAGDTGVLSGVRVTDTREQNGEIVHYCDSALPTGGEVSGTIDWARRFDLMQQHSGEHIVSGLVHRRFGYHNAGFHMGASVTAIDFDGVITPEELSEIERRANEAVWADVPVTASFPPPEELEKIEYRRKKELTGAVRIVTIPGADVCACCGTHVARTGEIGLIRFLSCQKLRGGVRVELVCGARAYDYTAAVMEQNRRVSNLLSAGPLETAEAVRRLQTECQEVSYRLVGLENRLFALRAEAISGEGDALLFEPGLTPDALRRLCGAVMKRRGGLCAVFSGNDNTGYKYAIGQAEGDVRAFVKEMNAALHGRGGGKPSFAQGSLSASRAEIEAFFRSFS